MICPKHEDKFVRKGKFGKYCKQCQTEKWSKTDEERVTVKSDRK